MGFNIDKPCKQLIDLAELARLFARLYASRAHWNTGIQVLLGPVNQTASTFLEKFAVSVFSLSSPSSIFV